MLNKEIMNLCRNFLIKKKLLKRKMFYCSPSSETLNLALNIWLTQMNTNCSKNTLIIAPLSLGNLVPNSLPPAVKKAFVFLNKNTLNFFIVKNFPWKSQVKDCVFFRSVSKTCSNYLVFGPST
jgi:hypothetical protein